jgi:ABC-2 type transport system permease protein
VRIAIWASSIVLLTFAGAVGVRDIYSDPRELVEYARTVEGNAAVIAFTGPTYAIETLGGRIAFEIGSQVAIAIALMALLSMTRHTRAEEESGRAELLRAAPMGRHAGLAAALAVTCTECVVIGIGVALALVGADLDATGAITFGALTAAVGIAFAAISAVAAQVTEHGRAASGISLAALGVAFVLRAIGDTSTPALRWLSPIGIAQHARAFAGERWWPLALLLVLSAALVLVAVRLSGGRDLGAGLVAPRPGPPRAAVSLGRPFGLALRLQRGVITAWAIGLFVFGAAMGAVAEGADDLIGDNPDLRDVIARAGVVDLVDSFLGTMTLMLALTACGFALQSAMRVRTEEAAGRGELVLSTRVSRTRWLGANLGVTVLGTALVLGAAGLGTGLAHG